jgi:hypothetical protein
MSVSAAQLTQLQQKYQNGASWFFWVGGLPIINAVIGLAGVNLRFLRL